MITIGEENIIDFITNNKEILTEHYAEAPFYEDIPIDPRLDIYEALDKEGSYFLLVARDNGDVIGYVSYILSPLPQFKDQNIADMELIYVSPSYRGEGIAASLVSAAETTLTLSGDASIFSIGMKSGTSIREFAESMGYVEKEVWFTKRIGEI